jgi:hypothetical protein
MYFKMFRKFTSVLLTIMMLFMSMSSVGADSLVYGEGDSTEFAIINPSKTHMGDYLVAGQEYLNEIDLAIVRKDTPSKDTFKNGSIVNITAVTSSLLVTIIDTEKTITLPSDWGSKSNGFISNIAHLNVKLIPEQPGNDGLQQADINFTAKGVGSDDKELIMTIKVTLTWRLLVASPADTEAPSGSIKINNDATYTNNENVTLSLNATDNVAVTGYRIALGIDASGAATVVVDPGVTPFSVDVPYELALGDGTKTVAVQFRDETGNWSDNYTDDIILDKTKPTLTWGSPTPSANGYGWNNTNVSLSFTTEDNLSGVADVSEVSPYIFTQEGADQTVTVKVKDNAENEEEFTSDKINIDKTAPVINSVLVSPGLVPVNTLVTFSVDAGDALSGIAKYEYRMDGGSWVEMVGGIATFTPDAAYVHEVEFRVTDKADNVAYSGKELLVVFDPDGGFVTGGGWIMSPEGAYAKDPTLTGKATFGFVSKYLKGANTPSGNTQFVFNAGGLNFHSTSYDWLVISGSKAQYKGYGNLNGESGYQFMLTATDGAVDMFRIKIWKIGSGEVVYDNQMGSADSAELSTQIGGGSIVIHVPLKKK